MGKYLHSVIMPAYNAEKYIKEAVDSVLAQTYSNVELVVVNDGSTDKTYDILNEYATNDSRVKFFSFEKNGGACAALNYALDNVNGDFVSWLSADDKYELDMIESSINYFKNHSEFDAVFSKHIFIDCNSNEVERWIPSGDYKNIGVSNNTQPYRNLIYCGNSFNACTVVAKTEMFKKTGYFNPDHQYAGDYDYMMRMSAYANIGFLDKYTVYSRTHNGQVTNQGKNDIDAIHVFKEMIYNNEIRKNLLKKAEISDGRAEIITAIVNRYNNYRSMNMENEASEVNRIYSEFMDNFEPVVKADYYLKQLQDLLGLGDIAELNKRINTIPLNIRNFFDEEKLMLVVASMYELEGLEQEESDILDAILRINPSNYEALYMKAMIYEKNGKYKESLKSYTEAVINSVGDDYKIILDDLRRFINEKL